jgi:hypothetical protein
LPSGENLNGGAANIYDQDILSRQASAGHILALGPETAHAVMWHGGALTQDVCGNHYNHLHDAHGFSELESQPDTF